MIIYVLIEQVYNFFILFDLTLIYITGSIQVDPDNDWRPHKKARHSDDDDDENDSTDESELNLLKGEAAEFVQGSSLNHPRPAKNKARVHIPIDDD